ncbi:MAG: hypothetical protein A2Y45_06385 [Tenericutes bacterium GWC2_34_14]|nr:MAG: hypothetical protein A2Z84_00775 [Tenericutes bacterium GWA2_35_7]OHE28582.1 MAG: hypothetical protein A2Y45_06385 [Tenericutes bacterium GWC2_34_14]OHE33510.1 MAG: hypothetical protein A2012_03425 [Tenericutes bacterium GWE2_34_108]OHE36795.1 MAG: hypothetical protein A2Y46_09225 [Tenericutes bacterium GWF1_35_14]OHE38125.1 MAG: hypothetical protein A2Y44_09440 [Tenericutes bacterium GWF2_35_184]OHE42147.1 MAG: hypothetical protein A3K26_07100 [Tenericutes bacterium RIFOXYA12_FULL_35_
MSKKIIQKILGVTLILLIDILIHFCLSTYSQITSLFHPYLRDILIQLTMFISGLCLYLLFTKGHIKDIGFHRSDYLPIKRSFYFIFLWMVIALTLAYVIVYFFDQTTWNMLTQQSPSTLIDFVISILKTGILPGISEETLYRGALLMLFLYHPWKNQNTPSKTYHFFLIVLSATIFTLAHLNHTFFPWKISYDRYQLFTSFALGAIQSHYFIKTRNLIIPIIIHNAWNILSFLMFQLLLILF